MKKILLPLSVCALLFGCKPDPAKYSDLIIGAWEVKTTTPTISGVTGEKYTVVKELCEKYDRTGEIFEFKAGNIFTGPEIEGTYSIDGNKLRIMPEGEDALNFTILNLSYRSAVVTYDLLEETPALTVGLPELTQCFVTVTAVKRKKPQQSAE